MDEAQAVKVIYLVLFVLGCVLPCSQLLPWLFAHGPDAGLFVRELFANRISAFFGLDVVVSAMVLLVWIQEERTKQGLRHAWLPVAATLLVGVSAGLPLFLYLRARSAGVGR